MHVSPAPADQVVRHAGPRLSHHAEHAVQRVADASVWLLFRLNGVRS